MKGLPSKDVNARDNEAGIIIGEQMQGKKQYTFRSLFHTYEPLIAGAFYCLMSMSMILTNKHVLSNFNYSCTNSILLLQNVMSVLFVLGGNLMGILQTEQMRLDIVKIWLPGIESFINMWKRRRWYSEDHRTLISKMAIQLLKLYEIIIEQCQDIWQPSFISSWSNQKYINCDSVNIIFVGMIWTGFFSLKNLGVGMFLIWR